MYKKLIETTIVRVTHEVSFGDGTRIIDLMDNLKNVPLNSRLFDSDVDDNGEIKLFFREEKELTKE